MLENTEDFPRTKGKKLKSRRRDGKFDMDIFYTLYEKGFYERGPLLLNFFDPACDDERRGSGGETVPANYWHNGERYRSEEDILQRYKEKMPYRKQERIKYLAERYKCSFDQMVSFLYRVVLIKPIKVKR